jgi:ATP-binding cassette subfamily A (ABC1) protein 1
MVVIRGLRKEYKGGRVVAVNNLSLGIERGSVFGFLGSNGAGKTTTLNVLSATDGSAPTKGHVTVDGHDPVTDPRAVHASIGVCPQFDTVFSLLTPIENLDLIASLRGVPLLKRRSVVDRIIAAVGLESHKNKVTATLSGGNRRKLSVAAALVGGPSLVVLDEPTAGIDTVARRALWGVISRVARQATVVLTTHHLAEVEHLASRAGIMVGGKLQCIGPLQRLKARFGDGLTLNARLRTAADVEGFVSFVQGVAPGAEVRAGGGTDTGGNNNSGGGGGADGRPRESRTVTMLIPAGAIRLSRLFLQLEAAVRDGAHGVSDYTVGQASVEDVFLKVVATSHEPTTI